MSKRALPQREYPHLGEAVVPQVVADLGAEVGAIKGVVAEVVALLLRRLIPPSGSDRHPIG